MSFNINVLISTEEQLEAIYTKSDLLKNNNARIYLESSVFYSKSKNIISMLSGLELYLCGPYVLREEDKNKLQDIILSKCFKGILIRNIETLGFLECLKNASCVEDFDLKIVIDSSMYVLNHDALMMLKTCSSFEIGEIYSSFELNEKEQRQLYEEINRLDNKVLYSNVIYGRIPMMISANCVKKTLGGCNHQREFIYIDDRMKKKLPVITDCSYCYNIIYNTVPLALNKSMRRFLEIGNVRIDFTNESLEETEKILDYYFGIEKVFPVAEYTTGHLRRGVE